jgi:hypothetical protein
MLVVSPCSAEAAKLKINMQGKLQQDEPRVRPETWDMPS